MSCNFSADQSRDVLGQMHHSRNGKPCSRASRGRQRLPLEGRASAALGYHVGEETSAPRATRTLRGRELLALGPERLPHRRADAVFAQGAEEGTVGSWVPQTAGGDVLLLPGGAMAVTCA